MSESNPDWLFSGEGIAPTARWSYTTDAPLISLDLARESGELVAADASGNLYRLDRAGQIVSLTRGLKAVRALAWSDTGDGGVVLIGESQFCRFNKQMDLVGLIDLPDAAISIAIDPFGRHVAASLTDAKTLVFNSEWKPVSRFETLRPLRCLQFLATEASIIGTAEYGVLCRHALDGERIWNAKILSNIGDMSVAGTGESVLLAGFGHGLQAFDGQDGELIASYLLEGTANHIACSFTADRVVASTLERHLYWLDSDGQLLWAAETDDDVKQLICDPLGEWIVCGFQSGRLLRLDWESPNR